MTDRHCLILHNDIAEVARLVVWIDGVVASLGLPRSTAHALHLCLEEAVTNVISHAFDPDTAHELRILVVRVDNAVHAEVTDDGRPFNPLLHELAAMPEDPQASLIGGLGIKLMRGFADGITYWRCGTLNRLRLSFIIPKPVPGQVCR